MSLHVPFRYDYVGSFLRNEKLLKARSDYEKEIITKKRINRNWRWMHQRINQKTKRIGLSRNNWWGIQKKKLAFGFLLGT